ncbi:hypothetical protein [endosymbiont of unidentified scaly snail isolate Monju]|uniref:hypothetical protein n=1 Tax=endosymbiont of unidentified scaly snail isolate Monju TaxID=1248727 RepID=UPI0005BCB6D0|nr:hypothetical protein [endosymbiont of unidentified scaly snail isolate Monju]
MNSFVEDNVRLQANGGKGSAGVELGSHLALNLRDEISRWEIGVGTQRRHYVAASGLDTTNIDLAAGITRDLERGHLVLDAAYRRDSTLSSEEGTSGLVQQRVRRERRSLEGSWTHQADERLSLTFSSAYESVAYDKAALFGLSDYRYGRLATEVRYGMDERSSLFAELSYSIYEGSQRDYRARMPAIFIGGTRRSYGDWDLSVRAGVRKDHHETATGSESGNSLIYGLSLKHAGPTDKLELALERDARPAGIGEMLGTEHLALRWRRHLTPRWRLHVDADLYRNRRLLGLGTARERHFLRLMPRLSYQVGPEWRLVGGYRFRYQRYEDAADSARAGMLFFNIIHDQLPLP